MLRPQIPSPMLNGLGRHLMYQVTPRHAALIIEHMQNDVVHPDGAFCQSDYRYLVPRINALLSHPGFALRVATIASPPDDHCIMAHNHPGKCQGHHIEHQCPVKGKNKAPVKQHLLGKYLQKGSWGHKFIDGLDKKKVDITYEKMTNPKVVNFSCFSDNHGNPIRHLPGDCASHDMQSELEKRDITDVFVLGLGGDHCVAETARDAVKMGYASHVVEDCLAFHDANKNDWAIVRPDLIANGVKLVKSDGPEIELLRHSAATGSSKQ